MNEIAIVFTVTRTTRDFGGLFNVTTKNAKYKDRDFANYTNVGVKELFDILQLISEQINNDGYAVLFEID